MNRFSTNIILIVAFSLCVGHMDANFAGDLPEPVVTNDEEKPPFPRPVTLIGYITKAGSSVALIDIDGQVLTLRQGEKKPFRLSDKVVSVWFASPIDFDNRTLKLGFPSFDYVDCRLGGR